MPETIEELLRLLQGQQGPKPPAPAPYVPAVQVDKFASPDTLKDELSAAGGDPISLGVRVASARQGQPDADPRYSSMTPEDRAALDRYATFVKMGEDSGNPLTTAANYAGGMGAMGLTELAKLSPALQAFMTKVQGPVLGSAAESFGGQDTSRPNLTNLIASHYGFMEGRNRARGSK